MGNEKPRKLPASWHLSSGAIAGAASVLILQPLDLLKTRLQETVTPGGSAPAASSSARLFSTVKQIVGQEGAGALWKGTTVTLYRNVPGVSLYFLSLSQLRSALAKYPYFLPKNTTSQAGGKIKLTTIGDLIVGSTARTSVGFILMPLTVLKTVSESTLASGTSKATLTPIKGLIQIYNTGGVRSLFRGAIPTAMRDAPGAGLFIVFYERGRRLLGINNPQGSTGVVSGGLMGASASLLSTLLTTPFDVLKTQRQLAMSSHQQSSLWATATSIYQTSGFQGFWKGGSLRILRKAGSSAIGWGVYEGIVAALEERDRRKKELEEGWTTLPDVRTG